MFTFIVLFIFPTVSFAEGATSKVSIYFTEKEDINNNEISDQHQTQKNSAKNTEFPKTSEQRAGNIFWGNLIISYVVIFFSKSYFFKIYKNQKKSGENENENEN